MDEGSVLESVRALLYYNWSDELRDFEENQEGREDHILRHMIRLRDHFGMSDDSHMPDPE